MLNKIKTLILALSAAMALSLPLVAAPAYATPPTTTNQAALCSGGNLDVTQSTASQTCPNGSKLNDVLATVINVISLIVGVLAVIMVIIGGFRYIASGGKEEGIKGAKNMILYALIGLVIVALAQLIVHFVLNRVTTATT